MTDTSFILWVQQFAQPWLTNFFLAVTALGAMEYYMVAIPIVYWLIDKHLGFRFAVFFTFSAYANSGLKYLFAVPRPPYEVRLTVQEGYSFPSGHAQGSTAFWGFLALHLRQRWAWAGAAVLIALISFSRIYLGVHYPLDILGGIAMGALLLGGYQLLHTRVSPDKVPLKGWLWTSIGIALALYLFHPHGDGPVTAGFILGALLGYALEMHTVDFSPKGRVGQNILRLLLGIGTLFVLRISLKPLTNLFPGTTGDLARYTLLGLWASLGAPWLFVRLGLAQSNKLKKQTTSLP
ncbi:MAG: phosphatase PAP2 family protein [Limnochordia bacterium]|jgi:membrane-associated phospholipid phosphatase